MQFTPRTIGMFFMSSCIMLIALYFLYAYIYYLVLAIFCLVSCLGLQRVLDLFIAMAPCRLPPYPISLPLFGTFTLWSGLSAVFSLVVVIVWAVHRASDRAWIVQDMLGIAFLVSTIQFIRLPSLKVSFALAFCIAF